MIKPENITAIVLCGGLGTRIQSVNNKLPKPMLEVAGRPFLEYLLDDLILHGVKHVVLAVSHKKEYIIRHFGSSYKQLSLRYSIESTPLGTGGAVKQAIKHVANPSNPILILNGDSYTQFDLKRLTNQAINNQSVVMLLKHLTDTGRYGRVVTDNNRVVGYQEKQGNASGLINCGVYLTSPAILDDFDDQYAFSFESDFLERELKNLACVSHITDGYFIDIGIPQDYEKSQRDFALHFGTSNSP